MFKRKLVVALLTTINAGIIYMLFNNGITLENSIISFISDLFVFTILISIVYVAPIVFILGIPISIGIDKVTNKIRNTLTKVVSRFLLHAVSGIIFLSVLFFLQGSLPIISDGGDIINLILVSIYPSTFFGLIDLVMKIPSDVFGNEFKPLSK
ncbi:hypothetical protein [Paraliobacillus sediminis]|uniref:hypothetical protein n=1 Tax=Paraliobacillus sediminis TaxID=1885916 RepID=UPI000E3DBAB3|nr:hypothetical protein [Paraliobacillus sediminis]